ncbi:MAG: glutamate--cysteine ligase [Ilumatobacter sp.]|uniref:glutamate--cysteine ligase n=1 Tax=Ilumatobacter sp. TaxID=1967498 RepID=UPI0026229A17|nr:glutamate--cysteine ligase [Ilumatobacter sp.]MDJ0769149.1 glutamate--cysteine ligase [Ilumatobacter sp.]
MPIEFTHNPRPTVGVELELHLVDRDSGDLVSAANHVLEAMGARYPGGEHPRAKHELFQSTVEIITDVCTTPAEVHRDLRCTLDELTALTEQQNIVPMSAGTHPFARASEQLVSPAPRYHDLIEAMQWPARRLLICGTHVHVAVPDGEHAITVINELTRHLPLFLALSSSSPFFEGEDSGLASARSKVFESLPTAGLPPQIADWVDFESFMSTLLDSECISSIREVWWDIRPHPDFGTVELRMCDATPTLSEATALAALAQALVVWCGRHIDAGTLPAPPREWTVRENRWLAGRYGMDATLIVEDPAGENVRRRPVRELVEELLDELKPVAEELGSAAELADVRTILAAGSGTERQRRLIDDGGTLPDVVHHLARELADDRPLV